MAALAKRQKDKPTSAQRAARAANLRKWHQSQGHKIQIIDAITQP